MNQQIMYILLDLFILLGSVLASLFCIYRSHVNFSKGYIRLGYAYIILWMVAMLIFLAQSFLFGV